MATTADRSLLVLRWTLPKRRLVRVLAIACCVLFLAGLQGQAVRFRTGDGHLWGFTPKFNLDGEMNVPTWFSSVLLAFSGFLSLRSAAGEADAKRRRRWRLLGWGFIVCSLDEVAACHEMLVDPVRVLLHARGLFYFAWVVPAFLLVGFLAAYLAPLFLRLAPALRRDFILAALVFLAGSLGLEMIGGAYAELHGPDHFAYSLIAHFEELLELLGQVLFIRAALELPTLKTDARFLS
jgi:hypothetical protein